MKEWKCPECQNVILNSNINTETGLAQCEHCGNVINKSDLVDTQLSDESGHGFRDYNPPESTRHQVIKNEDGILHLYLPKAGFQCGTIFNVVNHGFLFIVIFITGIYFLPNITNSFFAIIPILVSVLPAYRLATRINRATLTESMKIKDNELTLNMYRPLGPNTSTTFNLSDIQGLEYENEDVALNKVGIKMPRMFIDNTRRMFYYRAYVVTGDDMEVFFMQEDPEAKEWLVNYLDEVIKNLQAKQA